MVSAMVYPAILFGVAVIAILIFLTKIIPTFGNLFKGFDIEMPLLTRMMLGVSDAIQKWSGVTLAGGFVFFLLFRQFIRTSFGKQQFDTVKLKIPIFGNLVRTIAIEHFTSEMSTLIESGVPILYALEISERTSGNKVLEGILRDVKNAVRSGKTISEPLEKSGFFPPMVVQMIGIGEEIGELSDMLKKIAIFYEAQIETFINRFTVIIEPVMLVFMGGIIGLMVVSMFLPIFSIANIGTK
jgi:type IV pilus assembly protein PilC